MSICWGVSDQEYVVLLIAHNPSVSCIVQEDVPLHMFVDQHRIISLTGVIKPLQLVVANNFWIPLGSSSGSDKHVGPVNI